MSVNWFFGKCRRYQQGLSLLAVDALEPAEREKVTAHLQECPACRVKHAELRALGERLSQDGKEAPELEVPTTLRRRWTSAIRDSGAESHSEVPVWANWLGGRGLKWGTVGVMWALILLFRLSGPEVSKPMDSAVSRVSVREVWLVLKSQPHKEPVHARRTKGENSLPAESLPPSTRSWPRPEGIHVI